MRHDEYVDLVNEAVRRVNALDEVDRKKGNQRPDQHWLATMNTAAAAIEAAIKTEDWGIAAEALVMLERFTKPIRGQMRAILDDRQKPLDLLHRQE